jgi:hypothetical protein
MRLGILSFALMIAAPSALSQPAKVADLAKPPANAQEFSIISTVGTHGHSYCWTGPDDAKPFFFAGSSRSLTAKSAWALTG